MHFFHRVDFSLVKDRPLGLAIGNFDGFHLGHQAVIRRLIEVCKEQGLTPAVMIFEPQPLEFFKPQLRTPRLSSLGQKLQVFRHSGIECVICMHFDKNLASLSAADFVAQILNTQLKTRYVVVGSLFNFGRGAEAGVKELQQLGRRYGIEAEAIAGLSHNDNRISSTAVRQLLCHDKLEQAHDCLGTYYAITGKVCYGNQVGHSLGYPTANLVLRYPCALTGVYAVRIVCGYGEFEGMANIGTHPSVKRAESNLLEVHFFDFDRELYGQRIKVSFVAKLRPEQEFASLSELQAQLMKDKAKAAQIFRNLIN